MSSAYELERALPHVFAAQPGIVVAAPLRGEMKGDRVPAKRQSRALDEWLLRLLLGRRRASVQVRNLERWAAHVQRPSRQTATFGVIGMTDAQFACERRGRHSSRVDRGR